MFSNIAFVVPIYGDSISFNENFYLCKMEHNKFQNRRWTYGNGKNKKNRYGFDFTPIGLDIKTFREAQKITREKLAETLDISPRHLQAIELEGKHPSLGLLAYIATIFDMPIDPYIFPEKADAKSAVRKRLDVLLDKLNDRDLSILEATAVALCKAKEQPED